jgi:dihydroorotate dehydrogenase
MLYPIAQKIMMQIDPEKIHDWVLGFLNKTGNNPLSWLYRQQVKNTPTTVMGITFPNCIGLAAGMDKDGEAIDAFHKMGFGHIEVGTVTPLPQPGNPQPRMFRITSKKAIVNRMGFNNKGVDNLVCNLKARQSSILVGVNIGKNKDTPVDEGKNDYLICMEKVYLYADYITVNISSPNTPGLRSMQYGDLLDDLLSDLKAKQSELSAKHKKYVPLALKIAPDLTSDEISIIASSLLRHKFDGAIATNTTICRDEVKGLAHADELGGLSGCPLNESSTNVIQQLHESLGDQIPIIGVGGINCAADANSKLDAGAQLVQIYTGFIYNGPNLIKQITQHCART